MFKCLKWFNVFRLPDGRVTDEHTTHECPHGNQ